MGSRFSKYYVQARAGSWDLRNACAQTDRANHYTIIQRHGIAILPSHALSILRPEREMIAGQLEDLAKLAARLTMAALLWDARPVHFKRLQPAISNEII